MRVSIFDVIAKSLVDYIVSSIYNVYSCKISVYTICTVLFGAGASDGICRRCGMLLRFVASGGLRQTFL